jgi:hypothetical protein
MLGYTVKIASVVIGLIVIGCATQPVKERLSVPVYDLFECPQLAEEAQSVAITAAEIAGLPRQAGEPFVRRGDLVVFWPAAFEARTGGSTGSAELARLKGEFDAIQQAAMQKSCSIRFEAQ